MGARQAHFRPMGVSSVALTERVEGIKGPQKFADYLRRIGQLHRDTARAISVQSLDAELRENGTMVLRLGEGLVSRRGGNGGQSEEEAFEGFPGCEVAQDGAGPFV